MFFMVARKIDLDEPAGEIAHSFSFDPNTLITPRKPRLLSYMHMTAHFLLTAAGTLTLASVAGMSDDEARETLLTAGR